MAGTGALVGPDLTRDSIYTLQSYFWDNLILQNNKQGSRILARPSEMHLYL
jgi:hypothetical protein